MVCLIEKNEELGPHKSISLEQLKDILSIKDIAFVDLHIPTQAKKEKNF